MSLKKTISRNIAIIALSFIYSSVAWFSRVSGRRGGKKKAPGCGKILVIGTFHNPNWFHSHIGPLCLSGVEEVILVCDHPVALMERLRYACPPRLLSLLVSRAVAKFIWTLVCGFRYRPDLYMGYHIFPAAVSALLAARIFNKPACYQVTSGPLELAGGGWQAENRLLTALAGPSLLVEKAVFAAVREFDLIVVRGTRAQAYIHATGYQRNLAIITGSAEVPTSYPELGARDIDLVFVGRLTEYKRPERFVAIVAEVAKKLPTVTAVMLGDGPDRDSLVELAETLGITDNIEFLGKREDVAAILSRSKVFVLTSRWEGLSIAMIEAMMAGAIPVVSDVGDLRDLVQEGTNGFVVAADDSALTEYRQKIILLLTEKTAWQEFSRQASHDALNYSSLPAVSQRWHEQFSLLKLLIVQ